MFDFHKNHKNLINTALFGFVTLSLVIAVIPAFQMQETQPFPEQPKLTPKEKKGLSLYISEGCVACHTQQVRNIEMDKVWGNRPSMPSDYYYSKQRMDLWRQSPSLLGSERTGPDLTNIGVRQPGAEWHLLHLYNPRTVVKASVMPSYPWLFEIKDTTEITENDVVVPVSSDFFHDDGKQVIASEDALYLVAYLQSLKQFEIAETAQKPFISSSKEKGETTTKKTGNLPDGKKLFLNTCAACHQSEGQGLKGAFPPLAGSPIVNDQNPEQLLNIILQGYDARAEYGQMPGFASQLSDEEIAAIVNHERTNWGNDAPPVTAEDVTNARKKVIQ